MAFLKTKDLKKYTVQSLRSEVRGLIKEANRIIYELDESKKAGYMTKIAQDIAESRHVNVNRSGQAFTQTKVKYMRKGQLQTLYNELTAFIEADRQSIQYAKRLAGRKETMRKKTAKAIGKSITKKQYDTWLDIWDEYEDYMEEYGYREMLDLVKQKDNKNKDAKNIIEDLDAIKDLLASEDIPATPGNVLTYAKNRNAIESLLRDDPSLTITEAIRKLSTQ